MMKRRIFLKIAYDGTDYVGWQIQPNGTAVEDVINQALSALTGEDIVIAGASRTDSGVHAKENVAVFDTESRIPADKMCFALNQRLPKDIVCTESFEVSQDFHPRRADCTKTYEYRIYNSVHPDPLKRRYSYFIYVPLDVEAMKKAAEYLVGEHDFASFCSAHAQVKTTIRTVYSLEIFCPEEKDGSKSCGTNSDERIKSKYTAHDIVIRIKGNGFLYNMVRIIAGTLVKVGYHFYPPEHVKEILEGCDRKLAGPKAPAEGLTLVGIDYSEEDMFKAIEEEDQMVYGFYGAEKTDLYAESEEYPDIHTVKDLYRALSDIWCADTCAPRLRAEWSKDNKTLGQCSITAFLVQDIFGGKVYGIPLENGNVHCYNVVGDCLFDLTSEQFKGKPLKYTDNPEQSREVHFSREEKLMRYRYLCSELKKAQKMPEGSGRREV